MYLLVFFQLHVLLQLPRSMALCSVKIISITALLSSGASRVLHYEVQRTVSALMENGTRQFLFVKVTYLYFTLLTTFLSNIVPRS